MPGLPLSDEELSTVLREALLRIAKRYAPSEYPTEDADFLQSSNVCLASTR